MAKDHQIEVLKLQATRETSAARTQTSIPITSGLPVTPVFPDWVPPQMHMQAKLIKDRAVVKWKDDYSMQEYEIEKETKALEQLRNLNRFTANKPLLARSAQKWPDSFSMMLYEFDKQADAKKAVNSIR